MYRDFYVMFNKWVLNYVYYEFLNYINIYILPSPFPLSLSRFPFISQFIRMDRVTIVLVICVMRTDFYGATCFNVKIYTRRMTCSMRKRQLINRKIIFSVLETWVTPEAFERNDAFYRWHRKVIISLYYSVDNNIRIGRDKNRVGRS